MSYQLYYKWKVFKDINNQIFVFSFDGSNNCTIINRYNGKQLRERDWHLFFRGNIPELQTYLNKIDSYKEGFATSRYKGITKEQLFNKIIKITKTADNINNLKDFFYMACAKYEYNKEHKELLIIDLYDYKEEDYFAHNSKKEYLYLKDKSSAQLSQKGY